MALRQKTLVFVCFMPGVVKQHTKMSQKKKNNPKTQNNNTQKPVIRGSCALIDTHHVQKRETILVTDEALPCCGMGLFPQMGLVQKQSQSVQKCSFLPIPDAAPLPNHTSSPASWIRVSLVFSSPSGTSSLSRNPFLNMILITCSLRPADGPDTSTKGNADESQYGFWGAPTINYQ